MRTFIVGVIWYAMGEFAVSHYFVPVNQGAAVNIVILLLVVGTIFTIISDFTSLLSASSQGE